MKIGFNYLIVLLAFCIIDSCSVLHEVNDVAGDYINKWYDTQHELKLYTDNNFVFFIKEGLLLDTIKGTWSAEGKQLLLKADYMQSYYKANKCDTCKNIFLEVYDSHNKEKLMAYYKAYEKGTVKSEGNTDQSIKLPNNIDSVHVETLGYNSLSLEIDKNQKRIEVFLSEPESNLLKNKFYIKKNKIKVANGLVLEKQ